MRILLVTATSSEADIIRRFAVSTDQGGRYIYGNLSIELLITGVGTVATAWALTRLLSAGSLPDLAINAGIAGSFREEIKTGEVVVPVSDCIADAGIETGRGFISLAEAGLEDPDIFPFTGGRIISSGSHVQEAAGKLRTVSSITVNTASGNESTICRLVKKYDPDIETMEGAAFFYVCSREMIPFLALRAISNKVEIRNRNRWDITLALDNLARALEDIFLILDR